MVRGMSAHGVRPCPVYFSARDKRPGASCYLRVYMCRPTTILIIILLLLLCVIVYWFGSWHIYG